MDDTRVKTAIIGLGRWGQNVARELGILSDVVAYATNGSPQGDALAATLIPHARRMTLEEICADASIHAVAIATPIPTHATLVRSCLTAGKDVFVEKPLGESSKEAFELAQLAEAKHLSLMTGYIFLHHPVYQEFKKRVAQETPTEVKMVWKKYGTFGESIELNLLTHHLALALDLFGMPEHGTLTRGKGVESVCDALEVHLSYPALSVYSSIDRVSEEKSHSITATFADGHSLVWNGTKLIERAGEKETIVFESAESPLRRELAAFLCAEKESETVQSAMREFGAQVLTLHEFLTPN